jgi:GT2 family glycosyltransferase
MKNNIAIIIVTHNSEKYLSKNLDCLEAQNNKPSEVIIVDSASQDQNYIKQLTSAYNLKIKVILESSNVGFAKANNIGLQHVDSNTNYIIFLNPDAFLTDNFITDAILLFEKNTQLSVLTGKLLRYDLETNKPTRLIDSTGIFRTWYGKWYDRGQGEVDNGQYDKAKLEYVPAICGALLLCKYSLVQEIIRKRNCFFDETFFMYKEDIELSLYLNSMGNKLGYSYNLEAFHCRGWNKDRKKMSKKARFLSARNDLTVAFRYSKISIPFAVMKSLYVRRFE